MGDFNIDDYLNDPDFENKMEAYKETMLNQAINSNFDNIKKNGISDWHVRHMEESELIQLKETLQFMITHFIELEHYEKCGLLKSELEKINSILERV